MSRNYYISRLTAIVLIVIVVLMLVALLSGCYSQRKAKSQFAKAATAYPEIPADYCARIYPSKDSLIKGDTVATFDTIYTGGETVFDTVRVGDTIRIIKTVQLPGTKIIERYFVHDTLQVVNTAEIDLCRIEMHKAINLATDYKKKYEKWEAIAKKRFWIIAGMGFVIALGLFGFLRKKLTKPLK
jgi:hypothetical protein